MQDQSRADAKKWILVREGLGRRDAVVMHTSEKGL